MIRAPKTLFVMGAALTLIGASFTIRSDPLFVWNASASVPIGFYAITPNERPKVGDLVAVRPPAALAKWMFESGYLGRDTVLLKRIAALPGTEVCRTGTTILVDSATVAEARERDRIGRPLPVWRGCRTLRDGQVFFLNAEHPSSLDGRYFGPLGAETIIGGAAPLWTRGD